MAATINSAATTTWAGWAPGFIICRTRTRAAGASAEGRWRDLEQHPGRNLRPVRPRAACFDPATGEGEAGSRSSAVPISCRSPNCDAQLTCLTNQNFTKHLRSSKESSARAARSDTKRPHVTPPPRPPVPFPPPGREPPELHALPGVWFSGPAPPISYRHTKVRNRTKC